MTARFGGNPMNKQEAADFLGVSVRALERYVQQGKISVTYEKEIGVIDKLSSIIESMLGRGDNQPE